MKHSRGTLFIIVVALFLQSCSKSLVLDESQELPFTSFQDDTVYLTEAGDVGIENRLYMLWGNGNVARSGISPLSWVSEVSVSCVIGPGALSHDNVSTNTIIRTKMLTKAVLEEIRITIGNSWHRLDCPNEALNATSEVIPETFMYQGTRYATWWDGSDLELAEISGSAVINVTTVSNRQFPSNFSGNFQPSATDLDGTLYILTQLGAAQNDTLHIASSNDLSNWTDRFVQVDVPVTPRPQIIAFQDVLLILYHGFATSQENEIRYIYSEDQGVSWSDPAFLTVDTAVEPTGRAGSVGGFGVARHFNTATDQERLAVVWASDSGSVQSPPILISTYELVGQ